jgi:hypothetical protein
MAISQEEKNGQEFISNAIKFVNDVTPSNYIAHETQDIIEFEPRKVYIGLLLDFDENDEFISFIPDWPIYREGHTEAVVVIYPNHSTGRSWEASVLEKMGMIATNELREAKTNHGIEMSKDEFFDTSHHGPIFREEYAKMLRRAQKAGYSGFEDEVYEQIELYEDEEEDRFAENDHSLDGMM